jgi:hypothetical protein
VSACASAYNALKTVMLVNERFDRIDDQLKSLNGELRLLATSHAELAERVARIEGLIEGMARAAVRQPRLPRA